MGTIFLNQVAWGSKTFNTIRQGNYSTFIKKVNDSTFVNWINSKDCFKDIPWILFQLLVAKAQTTVFLVDIQYLNFDFRTNGGKLRRMFDFLGPAEVANMDKAVDTFLNFNKYTEIGEIANFGSVSWTNHIPGFNLWPWVVFHLFDTQRHFVFIAIQGQDGSFHLVSDFQEVLSRTEVLGPAHFWNVDQTFNARSDFDKCSVISDNDHFSFDNITHLEISTDIVPWMWGKLL